LSSPVELVAAAEGGCVNTAVFHPFSALLCTAVGERLFEPFATAESAVTREGCSNGGDENVGDWCPSPNSAADQERTVSPD
jgi:hypothetical protein